MINKRAKGDLLMGDRFKQWTKSKPVIILSVSLIMVFSSLLIVIFLLLSNNGSYEEESELDNYLESEQMKSNSSEEDSSIQSAQVENETMYVDVKGAVHDPGVYQIKEGMRLMDAIESAGGFLVSADQSSINLALRLTDQMVIYVPQVGETIETATLHSALSTQSDETASDLININTADLAQLQTLNGIGEKKAQEIIRYREENGSFQKIEEILEVSGIGDKTFESLKAFITVGQ